MADTNITVNQDSTAITIPSDTNITITEDVTSVDITASTPETITTAAGIGFNPYGTVASTNVQSALQEIADQFSIQTSAPGTAAADDMQRLDGGSF